MYLHRKHVHVSGVGLALFYCEAGVYGDEVTDDSSDVTEALWFTSLGYRSSTFTVYVRILIMCGLPTRGRPGRNNHVRVDTRY